MIFHRDLIFGDSLSVRGALVACDSERGYFNVAALATSFRIPRVTVPFVPARFASCGMWANPALMDYVVLAV